MRPKYKTRNCVYLATYFINVALPLTSYNAFLVVCTIILELYLIKYAYYNRQLTINKYGISRMDGWSYRHSDFPIRAKKKHFL